MRITTVCGPATFRGRILAYLAGRPDGAPNRDIAAAVGVPGQSHHAALNRCNVLFGRMAAHGLIEQAGVTERGWQQPASVVWRITPAGRAHLAALADAPARREAAARAAEAAERARADRAGRFAAVAATVTPGCPAARRRAVVPVLRDAGGTLRQIADVFGVSRTTILGDLRTAGGARG